MLHRSVGNRHAMQQCHAAGRNGSTPAWQRAALQPQHLKPCCRLAGTAHPLPTSCRGLQASGGVSQRRSQLGLALYCRRERLCTFPADQRKRAVNECSEHAQ